MVYADGIELMFVGIGLITVPLLVLIYTRINAKRDAAEQAGEKGAVSKDEVRRMGDRALDFRYTL